MRRYTVVIAIITALAALGSPGLLAGQGQQLELGSLNLGVPGKSGIVPATPSYVYLPVVGKNDIPPYRDDFSNSASGWPTSESSVSARGYTDGEYRILLKEAGWLSRANLDYDLTDFRVEVDARSVSGTNGTYGIVFDITDAGYYLFEVGYGQYHVLRRNQSTGTWVAVISAASSSAIRTGTQTNRLKVVQSGSSAMGFYVNGTLLANISEASLAHGYVGVSAGADEANYEARFDNFLLVFNTTDTTTLSLGEPQAAAEQLPASPGLSDGGFAEEPASR